MVEDFAVLKKIMREEISDILDHSFAVWRGDIKMVDITDGCIFPIGTPFDVDAGDKVEISFLGFMIASGKKIFITDLPPTAEVLCRYFFNKLTDRIYADGLSIRLISLEWQETPNNIVVYKRDEYNYNAKLR
jgi:6-pyruvoyl-tetrahydropterin synthase